MSVESRTSSWPRVIVHADMDAFYAAIEQLDDPALRGKPVLVGPPSNRGVVLTASYEARPYNVGSAMPIMRARRLCPQAIVVPPRFERYQQVSEIIMDVFGSFSPHVEPLSLDEAFIDMSGAERIFGAPEAIGARLKRAVREATGGLTASIGISATKYVAKVASGYRKPDGLTIVPPDEARAWLAPLPVSSLWGAGPKTEKRLRALGLDTIGDVAACDSRTLTSAFGATGLHFHLLAHAEDVRIVESSRRAKSVGSERTLNVDVSSRPEIAQHLRRAAENVGARLRRRHAQARGVRVKLKRSDFTILTRQRTLARATDTAAELFATAETLLADIRDPGPFRLVGLAAYDLVEDGGSPQLGLPWDEAGRARRLEITLDRLAERYGSGVVQRAAEMIGDHGVGIGANLDFLATRDGENDAD